MNQYIKVSVIELPEELRTKQIMDSILEVIVWLENKYNADFVQYIDSSFILRLRPIPTTGTV